MLRDCLAALLSLRTASGTQAKEADQIRQAIARQDARRARALDAFLDGSITKDDWVRQARRWEAERRSLEDLLRQLTAPPDTSDAKDEKSVHTFLEKALDGAPCVLEEVIERIVVFPDVLHLFVWELPVFFQLRLDRKGSGRSYAIQVTSCTPFPRRENTSSFPPNPE